MIETPHARDARRQVPVYSLYSETREPTAEMLRGYRRARHRPAGRRHARLHLHLHDGQLHARRGATRRARRGLRPAEPDRRRRRSRAPLLRRAVDVVRRPVPDPAAPRDDDRRAGAALQRRVRHRLRARRRAARRLAARRCTSTRRGLPWVIPSPNLPTLDSAIVYPGAVLFEGTMLSEGRGTTRPFELIGAPWIDGERLADAMNARGLPGVHFRAGVLRADVPEAREADVRRAARSTSPIGAPSSRCGRRSS